MPQDKKSRDKEALGLANSVGHSLMSSKTQVSSMFLSCRLQRVSRIPPHGHKVAAAAPCIPGRHDGQQRRVYASLVPPVSGRGWP